jgi:hypothetical protein
MIRINYINPSVLEDAGKKVDQGLLVEVAITGPQARQLTRAFHHYLSCFDTTRSEAQRKSSFLKWVLLAHSCPSTLWSICTRARLNGMTVEGLTKGKSFVVKFGTRSPLNPSGVTSFIVPLLIDLTTVQGRHNS